MLVYVCWRFSLPHLSERKLSTWKRGVNACDIFRGDSIFIQFETLELVTTEKLLKETKDPIVWDQGINRPSFCKLPDHLQTFHGPLMVPANQSKKESKSANCGEDCSQSKAKPTLTRRRHGKGSCLRDFTLTLFAFGCVRGIAPGIRLPERPGTCVY